ncbi:MAG: protocatechuate 3,4-dioxygenase [Polyangiaceae bacterium]|nr:protocatechuate 3,4-dioxygenase [Polyangiaceae bacterium]
MLRLVSGLGAAALLVNCGDNTNTNATAGSGGAGGSGSGGAGAGGEGGAGGSSSGGWASGGTSVLEGKDYGNPFESGIGPTCNVYKSSTEGPCHATSDKLFRKDVSEGYPGLPTRLEFLIVDVNCNPVPGATLEIWHCDTHGLYSGDIDGNNDAFCTGGDAEAAGAYWYRGIQTAGADGRVTFDTNFPGWYGGRANHIHFKVSVGNSQYLTSQVFFAEELNQEIYNSQPNYEPTSKMGYQPIASDKVIQEAGLSLDEVVMQTEKQSDGALLAWKAITINA